MHFRVLKLLNWNFAILNSFGILWIFDMFNNKLFAISWLHGILRYTNSNAFSVCVSALNIIIESMACIAYIICVSFNVWYNLIECSNFIYIVKNGWIVVGPSLDLFERHYQAWNTYFKFEIEKNTLDRMNTIFVNNMFIHKWMLNVLGLVRVQCSVISTDKCTDLIWLGIAISTDVCFDDAIW